jgi:hypothetical protein
LAAALAAIARAGVTHLQSSLNDIGLVQYPGWLLNKSCKMLCILLFFSGSCLKTEVFKQLY